MVLAFSLIFHHANLNKITLTTPTGHLISGVVVALPFITNKINMNHPEFYKGGTGL